MQLLMCVQEQLDCQPFSKAPRVPPAQTPGIRKPRPDTAGDPASPVPKTEQLDIFVDSFIDNIISTVKLELTATAITATAGPMAIPAAAVAEGSTPEACHAKEDQTEAEVQPIPSTSQPTAAAQFDSHFAEQQAALGSQPMPTLDTLVAQTPVAEATAANKAEANCATESIVQDLVQGMLDKVASGAEKREVRLHVLIVLYSPSTDC